MTSRSARDCITASARLIGPEHRNRWWENLLMGALFLLALYFAFQAFTSLARLMGVTT